MAEPLQPDGLVDEVAAFNRERWNELARAGVRYSVPILNLDPGSARMLVDPNGVLGDLVGKEVLCLAAGGGQQSAAFSLLGARVTVIDLSAVQLERDLTTARHYEIQVRCELGDMRDLSRFSQASFDIVWQAHSLNFVPDATTVFAQVSRVIRDRGLYRLECTNPFIQGNWETSWNGKGYLFTEPYLDGEVTVGDPYWNVSDAQGVTNTVLGPREFRHTYSTLINGLIANEFELRGLWEDCSGEPGAAPGSWEHFKTIGAPWITLLGQKKTLGL